VAVCNAVAYAHSRGVIHRDLKPANVMLGKFGETLLVDWGLAKVVGRTDGEGAGDEQTLRPSSGDGSATVAGTAVGTPAPPRCGTLATPARRSSATKPRPSMISRRQAGVRTGTLGVAHGGRDHHLPDGQGEWLVPIRWRRVGLRLAGRCRLGYNDSAPLPRGSALEHVGQGGCTPPRPTLF
jgi:hypothetical protein